MYYIAHRGNNNHRYVSNTTTALLDSLNKDYISGVELDIRMTKDKKIVIFHDFLIDDKEHKLKPVATLSYQELKKYDLGDNNHIDLLADFLSKVNYQHKKIMIEIKEESNDYIEVLNELIKIIEKYKLNYYLCSFNYRMLEYLKNNFIKYKVGIIIGLLINDNRLNNNFDFIAMTSNYLKEWNFSKETFVWTVNSKKSLKEIKKYKHNVGIITDKAYLFNEI